MSGKDSGGRTPIIVLVGLVGLAVVAAHSVALRTLFSHAALPIGAAAGVVAIGVVLHLGLLSALTSRLRDHLRSKRD
jgi:hypothetical protein